AQGGPLRPAGRDQFRRRARRGGGRHPRHGKGTALAPLPADGGQLDAGGFLPQAGTDRGNARPGAPGSGPGSAARRSLVRARDAAEHRNVAAFLVLRLLSCPGGARLGTPRPDRDARGYRGGPPGAPLRSSAPAQAAALAPGCTRRPRAGAGDGSRGARARRRQTEEKTMKKLGLPVAISLLAPALAGAEVETIHGYRIADPFRHFETEEGADPWIAEQHERTEAYLRGSGVDRAAIEKRLDELSRIGSLGRLRLAG